MGKDPPTTPQPVDYTKEARTMILAFSVAPLASADDTGSVSEAVAAAIRVVKDSGLPHVTSSMFTEIEGEWDEVFAVVKQATEAVQAFGPRVSLVMKADIRPGFTDELNGKLERLQGALDRQETPNTDD